MEKLFLKFDNLFKEYKIKIVTHNLSDMYVFTIKQKTHHKFIQ